MAKINNNRKLTIERLCQVLNYDSATGIFTWLLTLSPRAVAGSQAGAIRKRGYRIIVIDGEQHKASRLAWFYTHLVWPEKLLDHVNLDKSDDRILNLRQANNAENIWNTGPTVRSPSGLKGASRSTHGGWQSSICCHGKRTHLGSFETPEQASAAYKRAAEKMRGEFARVA